ncbi:Cyclopentanol dehydrogenase [Hyaloraphidium curvatum]|nr:Cyclopentanol dehydrogenase [Hyaloraphidium curvatum]
MSSTRSAPLPPVKTGTRLQNRLALDQRKVFLISGGANGIGARTGLRAAAEGADVVLADLPAQKGRADEVVAEISALGNGTRAIFVPLDVTSEESWGKAVEEVEAKLGPISCLLNGAGISGAPSMNLEDLDLQRWLQVQAVNSTGVMLGCKYGARSMMKLPAEWDKSIINVSSIMGLIANQSAIAYCASKGAVRQLTKSVALHLASRGTGIRCNSVHVRTSLLMSGGSPHLVGALTSIQTIAQLHALKRFASADEIASMVIFLASEDSSFCVGAEYTVDGGYTAQ